MKKTPVSNDKYVRFHAAFVLITNEFGILDDPDVARACDILLEKLAQRVGKTKAKQGQRGAWKFYNFFRQKYLQFTDFEYEGTFGAKEIKMTNIMLEKLNKHDVTMEEYVTWLFDELFPNNEKLSPGLGLALSSNILQDYLYRNRDKLSKKKAVKRHQDEETILLQRIRALIRETKDKGFVDLLDAYRNKQLSMRELSQKVEDLAKKHDQS